MEGAVNYVTQDTGAKTTNSAEHSTWTIRKIIILATIFLVFFVVFAAFSVYAPFFPSEVSVSSHNCHFQTKIVNFFTRFVLRPKRLKILYQLGNICNMQ